MPEKLEDIDLGWPWGVIWKHLQRLGWTHIESPEQQDGPPGAPDMAAVPIAFCSADKTHILRTEAEVLQYLRKMRAPTTLNTGEEVRATEAIFQIQYL